MIAFAIAGLVLGLVLGVYCPFSVPPEYARLQAWTQCLAVCVLRWKAIMMHRSLYPAFSLMVFWQPFCAMPAT